jgi:hypothetical protein
VIDWLTCDWLAVYQRMRAGLARNAWSPDCDCGNPPAAHHHSLCSITPIYAQMFAEFGNPDMTMPMLMARATVTRTRAAHR